MPSSSYITNADYASITSGDAGDATDQRLQRASMLLDVRCGLNNHASTNKDNDLLLLDMDDLNARQSEAVKQWVAWFTFALVENDDSVQVEESIRLGRFQVDARDKNELIPDDLSYADQLLKSVGIIRRDIRSHRNQVNVQRSLDIIADVD